MSIFHLSERLSFPPTQLAEPNGLLALGGDLSLNRLLLAYHNGIFPWYSHDEPILWWSPDPRLVLFPDELQVSRSLAKIIRRQRFQVTFDQAFEAVIRACAGVYRQRQRGTWIVPEMQDAYIRLHRAGYAHSAEAWCEGKLVGGLYGVALGRAFYGESMFSLVGNASKVALVVLVRWLANRGYRLIDCQVHTDHLIRFGAREIPRSRFLELLTAAMQHPPDKGPWNAALEPDDRVDYIDAIDHQ
jgi:leucyl/phenylalanyl-tRNA---protein transferase